MAPNTPSRTLSETPSTPPRQSTLRRKGAETFARSPFSSQNPFEPDDFEIERRVSRSESTQDQELVADQNTAPPVAYKSSNPLAHRTSRASRSHRRADTVDEDGFVLVEPPSPDPNSIPGWPFYTPPKFDVPKIAATASPRISKLRRKTDELFGEMKSAFDAEDEGLNQSPSLGPSTSQLKTGPMSPAQPSQLGTFSNSLKHRVFSKLIETARSVQGMHYAYEAEHIRWSDKNDQESNNFVHELLAKTRGNPTSLDAHDEPQIQPDLTHLINPATYTADTDPIVRNPRPRLADAVATTLFQTSDRCLEDFPNPAVRVFERTRNKQNMLIWREGKHVIVGTYQNYGTCWVWNFFVWAEISETGAWTDGYAGASRVITPVSAKGVECDRLVPGESVRGIDLADDKFALYIERALGSFMVLWEVWKFHGQYVIEWQADGVVKNAREVLYEGLRMGREEAERD